MLKVDEIGESPTGRAPHARTVGLRRALSAAIGARKTRAMKKSARPRRTIPRIGEARAPLPGAGFIRSISLELPETTDEYPFNVPAIRALTKIELHPAITFFIGENGTGKSTLLEAIARTAGFDAQGGWKRGTSQDVGATSALHHHLTIARGGYPGDGWFLRAESFYNVATALEELDREPFCSHGFSAYGGKSLHEQSHGEAFLSLLNHRLSGDGLYLFDEPEAALSPQRQLAVIALLHRLVGHHSQLIIATHSPILMAYPHARIYEFGLTACAKSRIRTRSISTSRATFSWDTRG